MYEVIFSSKAENQLKKLDKQIQERIIVALERISIRPEHFVEKLIRETGFKLRVGDYRIILDIDNNKLLILVLKLGHRKNIYNR